jgi:hypothetical protein
MPHACIDPGNPDHVVVIFCGRLVDQGSNMDVFVSESTNAGLTFPFDQTYHISDAMAGDDAHAGMESDEFMPSVSMDVYGGVNILVRQSFDPDSTPAGAATVHVVYLRWPGMAALRAGLTPFRYTFSGAFLAPGPDDDFHTITSRGCWVYPAWASQETGNWEVYTTRILVGVCAVADYDADGQVTTNDPAAFNSGFSTGEAAADIDRDEWLTTRDVVEYLDAYSQAGGAP